MVFGIDAKHMETCYKLYAGEGAAGTDVESYAGDPERTPVSHSMVPYRSVPLQRVPSSWLHDLLCTTTFQFDIIFVPLRPLRGCCFS